MAEAPPRLLWLNGPHYVGKRTLAAQLRDQWGAAVLDAEAIGFALQRGLPARADPGDLHEFGMWWWALWRLGVEWARTFRPVVVVPATIYRPDVVTQLVTQFREHQVEVLHVVLEADDVTVHGRIHGTDVSRDAKRWALEHLRPAVSGLASVSDCVRLDTSRRAPSELSSDLVEVLVGAGWLTSDARAWTTEARVTEGGPHGRT